MNNLDVKFFVPFQKKNEDQRIVEGYCTSETLDSQGEVIKATAIEAALPEYMKFGNIREMHVHSAVGKAIAATMDVSKKALYLTAKVVDPVAWEKVKEGVYNGYSIGGRVKKRIGNTIHELELHEISLVDRPANPDAIFSLYKSADATKRGEEAEIGVMERPKNMNIYLSGELIQLAMELCSIYDLYQMEGRATKEIEAAINSVKQLAVTELSDDRAKKVMDILGPTLAKFETKKSVSPEIPTVDEHAAAIDPKLWVGDYFKQARKFV